jgi:hypothetical protein
MSYNIARTVAPQLALCSFSSSGVGNVAFSFINGDFTPTITSDVITLDAGFEYFIVSTPTISVATTYKHIIDGVDQTSYTVTATSTTSGLDENTSSIQADASVAFSLYADQAVTSNSRLQLWRFSL